MNKKDVMTDVINGIESGKIKDFNDVLLSLSNPQKMIAAGLFSLGFNNVDSNDVNGLVTFEFNRISEDKKQVVFDSVNRKLSGDLAVDIEKAFNLGVAIETRLSDAMLYPHDMRQKIIASTCAEIGIEDSFYALVLSNWKST
jgi:hypothetical protein